MILFFKDKINSISAGNINNYYSNKFVFYLHSFGRLLLDYEPYHVISEKNFIIVYFIRIVLAYKNELSSSQNRYNLGI